MKFDGKTTRKPECFDLYTQLCIAAAIGKQINFVFEPSIRATAL